MEQRTLMLRLFANTGVNWLIISGLLISVVGLFAIFVVPRWINKALGLAAIVGIFFLAVGAIIAPKFVEMSSLSMAEKDIVPKNIEIMAVSQSEFNVKWETSGPVIGVIKYGQSPDSLNKVGVSLDPTKKRTAHEVSIGNLPVGIYYVKIISGGDEYPAGYPLVIELK